MRSLFVLVALLVAGCARHACWGDPAEPTCAGIRSVEDASPLILRDFACTGRVTVAERRHGVYDVEGCGRTARYDCDWALGSSPYRAAERDFRCTAGGPPAPTNVNVTVTVR